MDKARAGAKGGRATARKYGKEYMAEIGKKGFLATVARHYQGDREAYRRFLATRNHANMVDALAGREIRRRIGEGEEIVCVELDAIDDGDCESPY